MYGKSHSQESRAKIGVTMSKYPIKKTCFFLEVGILDLKGYLITKFTNNINLTNHLNISKVTLGKYLNSNLIYQNSYYYKPIVD